ncbi:Cytochrome c oxidase assembly factor 3 [Popillia japonica]|uniref:rRNA adenine N(6)-methyltransferase n=1 Tax=Popillia japonica TaxID=7064 RepID=A0AAW1J032_POPJA
MVVLIRHNLTFSTQILTKILKLIRTDLDFMRFIEKQNRERVEKLKRLRRNNLITAGLLGCGVFSIYFYSMFAVKQETFLDDFDEPVKTLEKQLRAIKQLSQNFLMDERITDKIVKTAGYIRNHYVCEVGPGPGGITRSIINRRPKKLVVVEKDNRFLPTLELLKESCEGHVNVEIEIGDILTYNFERGFSEIPKHNWYEAPPPLHIIGNLPFSVSTYLIIKWLKEISLKTSAWAYGRTPLTLTFQKEVAERIVAPVTDKQRCRLSLMCQTWCHVEHRFTIPGKAFVPKPDVDVGVVTFYPRKYPLVNLQFDVVEKLLRTIFNMRQKYSLRGVENLFPEDLKSLLGKRLFMLADVDYTARPFEITNEEFARLCYAYKALCKEYPIADYDYRASKHPVEL